MVAIRIRSARMIAALSAGSISRRRDRILGSLRLRRPMDRRS
jgi:hypothetical protein